jgi:hypothetical protein
MIDMSLSIVLMPYAELSRLPKGDRLELLVLPERSEGKEFDTAQHQDQPRVLRVGWIDLFK